MGGGKEAEGGGGGRYGKENRQMSRQRIEMPPQWRLKGLLENNIGSLSLKSNFYTN